MKLSISNKKKKELFVNIFQMLQHASSLINAKFFTDHMRIQGMDKSHICLYELVLKKDWFDHYSVDEYSELCFDSKMFFSIIGIKNDDQTLVVSNNSENNGDNDLLKIDFLNDIPVNGSYKKAFTMQLNEFDYEELSIPAVEYDAEFTLNAKHIAELFNQLKTFGTDIKVECKEDGIDFSSDSPTSSMQINVTTEQLSEYGIVEDKTISLKYSLTYLNSICITNKLTPDIYFSLSEECPMKIKYDLGNDSELLFYMAPKLDE